MQRRRRAFFLVASLLVFVVATSSESAPAGGFDATADGAVMSKGNCKRAVVNGKRICLRVGDRCKKRFQDDYVRAGYSCRRGRRRRSRGRQPSAIAIAIPVTSPIAHPVRQ